MNDRVSRLCVFLLIAASAGGCGRSPARHTILESSSHPYVRDLPLPVDFRLVERLSEDRVIAGHRHIRHVYQGKSDLQAVKNFYQQNMPEADWETKEQSLDRGVYLLRYRKDEERCDIRIERMPSGLFSAVIQVRTLIQPLDPKTRSRRAQPPANQP